jgi:hypothetical protein
MNKQTYDQIPESIRPKLQNTDYKVKFADGSIQTCLGIIEVPIQIENTVEIVKFLVGNYTDEGILGMKYYERFTVARTKH